MQALPSPNAVRQTLEAESLSKRHGVILRSEAIVAGLRRHHLDSSIRSGRWVPGPAKGTLLVASKAHCPLAHLTSATLGLGCAAWSLSALALWDLATFPERPQVVGPRQVRSKGVQTYRPTNLANLRLTNKHGIRTVALEQALASSANDLTRHDLDEAIDEALRKRLTTWARVEPALELSTARGRQGSAHVQQLLADRRRDSAVPLSSWSRMVRVKLMQADVPTPQMEWRVLDLSGTLIAQVDLAYPAQRYAIELDSVAFHHNLVAFETDRARDAGLLQAGWTVSRITWQQFSSDWPAVLRTVRAGLKQRKELRNARE